MLIRFRDHLSDRSPTADPPPPRGLLRGIVLTGVFAVIGLVLAPQTHADDAFYEIDYDDLTITDGTRPDLDTTARWSAERYLRRAIPRVVVDGEAEVYLGPGVGEFDAWLNNDRNTEAIWARGPEGQPITGTLYMPGGRDGNSLVPLKFKIPADVADTDARDGFFDARKRYYTERMSRTSVGSAWYRYQLLKTEAERKNQTLEEALRLERNRPERRDDWEDTYQILSGGRAVSENLQLDRLIRSTDPKELPSVDITEIEGIEIEEIDWTDHLKGVGDVQTDPLATVIPEDQHALLFASFGSLVDLIDEASTQGTPLLHLIQSRPEDARVRERYERQLCLKLDQFARTFGPRMISSVALTGSDPYFRTGTDVAVLFETDNPTAVELFIKGKQAEAAKSDDVRSIEGTVAGVRYRGVVNDSRTVCSYVARISGSVVVTNSLVQLQNLAETADGKRTPLSELDEYTFFRNRYKLGDEDESALLILTDATIRRWCGPQWRIGAGRRTRAAAIFSQIHARLLDENGSVAPEGDEPQAISSRLYVPDLTGLTLTSKGVVSPTYNTLTFMTPIAELDLRRVTPSESSSYKNWRNRYQRYWQRFYDPIALRISATGSELKADLTVMPLIGVSDYNEFIELTRGETLPPGAGDPHPESLASFTLALNRKSWAVQWLGTAFTNNTGAKIADPLGWIGPDATVYIDGTDFWKKLAESGEKPEDYIEDNVSDFPIALRIKNENPLKLTLFLTGLRKFITGSAPELVTFETVEYGERSYVKIAERGLTNNNIAFYYAATKEQFLITPNEALLRRALDREDARKAAKNNEADVKPLPSSEPLGKSIAAHFRAPGFAILSETFGSDLQTEMRRRCRGVIRLLNEMHALNPESDPVELYHEAFGVRPVCPGGGTFVWNTDFQTMESTVLGHPGAWTDAGRTIPLLTQFKEAAFGVTFEDDGLRSRAILTRKKSE